MRALRARAFAALLAAAAAGCGLFGGERPAAPDPSFGVQQLDAGDVVAFHERAANFYRRLAQRRFNTRATYLDQRLRVYFRSEAAFADYYADLADALTRASFDKNRPLALEVLEFSFDAPGEARVRVRMEGDDGRPLRPGETGFERVDRWERVDGTWWIVPGKL